MKIMIIIIGKTCDHDNNVRIFSVSEANYFCKPNKVYRFSKFSEDINLLVLHIFNYSKTWAVGGTLHENLLFPQHSKNYKIMWSNK